MRSSKQLLLPQGVQDTAPFEANLRAGDDSRLPLMLEDRAASKQASQDETNNTHTTIQQHSAHR